MRSFTGQPGTPLSSPGNVVLGLAPSAAIRAKECCFPPSSWVHAFILTCDDKLAVWFKRRRRRRRGKLGGVPGVCCLYPAAGPALYQLACTWHTPGKFVHRFLYRKLAYQLVGPPKVLCGPCGGGSGTVTVPCCSNPLPQTLHVTFTGALSASYALAWDGAHTWTNTSATGCGGATASVDLACASGHWSLTLGASSGMGSGTCSPLSLSFTIITPCGSVSATVTT
jgi:hypothetical protein